MSMNLDLFAGREQLEPLLDNLHRIPGDEREKLWEGTLSDLLMVMFAEMKRANMPAAQALTLCERLTLSISTYLGGRNLYLPAGTRIRVAVRDMLIFAEFNGRNFKYLQRKYHLSQPALYGILRREREAYRRRYQPPLF